MQSILNSSMYIIYILKVIVKMYDFFNLFIYNSKLHKIYFIARFSGKYKNLKLFRIYFILKSIKLYGII